MSSEVPDGSMPSPGRRPPRSGEGGAPVSGALTIVLAVVAVVAGFLILRAISNDDGSTSPGATGTTTTIPFETVPDTIEPPETTTTLPQRVTDGATVVVANANGVDGSATQMSRALEAAGYTMGSPTNAAGSVGQLSATVIYFDAATPAAQAVAESVNRDLGGDASISALADPAPTSDGTVDGEVLVMLGNDKAGKSLDELAPTTTAAPAVTSPDPSGDGSGDDGTVTDPDG